jgi:zinc protease
MHQPSQAGHTIDLITKPTAAPIKAKRWTMPRRLTFIGWVVLLAALRATPAAAQPDSGPIPPTPKELKYPKLDFDPPKAAQHRQLMRNGVVGYFVEDHDLPLITVSVTIRVGSYLDPAGKEGLSSAVGAQLRAGGTSSYQADQFDEEADFLAANISSSIGGTSGGASANFLAKDTDKVLSLLFEMLQRPAFQQDRLDLYKSQQLQQIDRRNDSTDEIEAREWNRLLRGAQHFTSVLSTKASIASVTREDLLEFHKKYYQPKNFIFAVSGDFNTAELKTKLDQALAGWAAPGVTAAPVPKPDFTPVPGVYAVDKPDVNQARVTLGHLGIQRENPDELALQIMNDILGGSGFTSRIMNRVRSDEGLAYSAGSSFTPGIYYEGVFRAAFQSKSSTVAQATQIVMNEIESIRDGRVTADELDTVKNYAIEVFPRYFATASAIAGTFANDEFSGRDPKYWETYREKIRALTAEDVQRVARKYLHPENLVILAVGNVSDILKGNPDKPEYSLTKIAGGKIVRIPLPDPATMVYPKQ